MSGFDAVAAEASEETRPLGRPGRRDTKTPKSKFKVLETVEFKKENHNVCFYLNPKLKMIIDDYGIKQDYLGCLTTIAPRRLENILRPREFSAHSVSATAWGEGGYQRS
jgi:hypothetical protein